MENPFRGTPDKICATRGAISWLAAAIDRSITMERLWLYPSVILTISMLFLGGTILLGDYPRLAGGATAFPDYLAHWTGGRMLLDGDTSRFFDPAFQNALQAREVGPTTLSWFVSPPFAALLYAPFALLNFGASALLWTVFSACCLVAALWLMRPIAPNLFDMHLLMVVLLMVATQPVLELLGSGQDSGLSLLLWIAGMRLMLARRDASAGVVFALGLFKPQQFLLVPIVLLVQRRFRALTAWLVATLVLAIASVAVVGVSGVVAWLRLPFSDLYNTAVQIDQAWKMQSLPALVSTALPRDWSGIAAAIGIVVELIAILVFIRQLLRAHRAAVPELPLWMLAILVTVAASPHLVIYDLVLVLAPILYLLEHHNTRTIRVSCVALFALTWTVPIRHVVAMDSAWPISLVEAAWTAVPLIVLWVVMARALRLTRTAARSAAV